MPQTAQELVELLELEEVDHLRYRGQDPRTTMQRTYGGQVMGQALSAMYSTVPDGRLCHSLTGYFLRPGVPKASIDYQVSVMLDGGSFSNRRVVAEQEGRPIFVMAASFKTPEDGFEHQISAFQPPPPPEDCPPLADVLAVRSSRAKRAWMQEWAALDVRYADSSLTSELDRNARLLVWVKTADDLPADPRVHQQVLAYASDLTILAVSTLTHPVDFYSPQMQVATINHSMWFHRPIRADRWVLYDQASPNASNALGLSMGRLYAGKTLGASCAQEGLIRMTKPDEPL